MIVRTLKIMNLVKSKDSMRREAGHERGGLNSGGLPAPVAERNASSLCGMAGDERGIILFTILMLMFIGSLLGVIALNSSNVEIQIAGYEKKVSTVFAATEAGIDVGIPIIEETWSAGTLTPTTLLIGGDDIITDKTNLGNEILKTTNTYDTDTPAASPDITIPYIGGAEVKIDIDRLYTQVIAGGALEFAQGYEGEGKGAAGGGMAIYYKIHSRGTR